MKLKYLFMIVGFSIIACLLYTLMLGSPYNNYFYTSAVKLILFLAAPFFYYSISKQGKFKNLFSFKGNKKYMKISVFYGVGIFILIIGAFVFLNSFFDRQMITDSLKNEGITSKAYPYVFVNIVFINAFLEELFFRGFVFFSIFNLGYKRFAYIFSSTLFSVYHVAMMNSWFSPEIFVLCVIGLIAAGLIFNESDRRCENISGGLFMHLGANLAINLIGIYLIY